MRCVYWLLSGYALRAWRALAALAVVVVLAGVVLAFWGFPAITPTFRPAGVDRSGALVYQQQPTQPPAGLERLPDTVRFSARSATALLRGPDRALTPLGEWLEIGLRFAGLVLLDWRCCRYEAACDADIPAPLRYVGVPPASRLGRARTPDEGMPLQTGSPRPAGR
jgi:hypothetical protein